LGGDEERADLKILLAIDDSQSSEAATRTVVQQMRSDRAEVCVLHVIEPWLVFDYELGEIRPIEAWREEGLKRGKGLVERIRPLVTEAGFTVTTAIEEGDPRFVIVEYTAQWKADLLVVGSHGPKGLGRLLVGSVAEYVVRHAHCSVLIVRVPLAR
jgi:nucleotide-binding universal stress UspA family protein